MRAKAKASSAGSNSGQGSSLGSVRRAFATRVAASDGDGSGAPSHRPSAQRSLAALSLATLTALLLILSVASPASAAGPPLFWQKAAGAGAGQVNIPRGVAVDRNNGHVFVADQNNVRIDEFDAWGEFIKAWGWDVVATGPGNSGTGFEICVPANGDICKAGTEGPGAGQLGTSGPGSVAVDSLGNVYVTVQSNRRVEKYSSSGQFLLAWGGDVASSGPGNTGANENQTVTVKATGGKFSLTAITALGKGTRTGESNVITGVSNTLGTFRVGDTINGPGIPAASPTIPPTTVTAVGPGTLTLSAKVAASGYGDLTARENTGATGNGDLSVGSSVITGVVTRTGEFAAGERISGSGIPAGTTIESVGVDTLTLSQPATANAVGVVLTATDISYNASAADIKAALEGLPGIGAGNVTVGGGPGDATGSAPYTVAFSGGPLAHNDIANMESSAINLDGASKSVTISSLNGGGPEICKPANGDVCKVGVPGTTVNGEFGAWLVGSFLAVGPGDKVYVGDVGRIQRFDAEGVWQESIGAGLIATNVVQSLAVDSVTGTLYGAVQTSGTPETKVRKWNAAGAQLPDLAPVTTPTFTPKALATDAAGSLYVVSGTSAAVIRKFNSAGSEVESWGQEEPPTPKLAAPTGIAAGSACLVSGANVYISNNSPSFLRAYGSPPNKQNSEGDPICPPPVARPVIKAQWGVSVDTDTARLQAEINPKFWADTTYFLEYGTNDCSISVGACDQRMPLSDAPLGSGVVEADITTESVFLKSLEPDTTYYYRFVAESGGGGPVYGVDPDGSGPKEPTPEEGEVASFRTLAPPSGSLTSCPNQQFRTGQSAFLPDCRAYEMVSPVDKNGGDIESPLVIDSVYSLDGTASGLDQSSGDGEGIAYGATPAFGDAVGAPYTHQYLAHRDPTAGWSTHGISPPQENIPGFGNAALDGDYRAFSEDLSEAWLSVHSRTPLAGCAPPDSINLYRRLNQTDSYEPLHCEPLPQSFGDAPLEVQGVSGSGCRAIFRSRGKLTADANAAKNNGPYQLYESNCEGSARLVGKLANGTNCAQNSSAGFDVLTQNGTGRSDIVRFAFSRDGHRLYWSCGNDLYLRTDSDLGAEGEETVVLVASNARFQTASAADGATMLFTAGNILKAYDAASAETTTIAAGISSDPVPGGGTVTLMGASEDASRAYFASTQVLPGSGQNSEGASAVAGANNLYLYEAGEAGPEFSFIGSLSVLDMGQNRAPQPLHREPLLHASRVSPDGLRAAFISTASLTGYDNTDLDNGKAVAEVYLYDAAANGGAGEVLCVSCNPTGIRPSGRRIDHGGGAGEQAAAWIPGWVTQLHPTRALSDDGASLFFQSFEALVPRDTNSRQDVYEWERAVSGAECDELGAELFVESAGGCLSLISSGQDPRDSLFVDADRDGSDVFIRTGESLVAWDPGSVDIYDARIGGGFSKPAIAASCEGEACQSPPAPPNDPTPASASFHGAGNVKDVRPKRGCPKGKRKVRRAGKIRCVKRKHNSRGSHSRSRANDNRRTAR